MFISRNRVVKIYSRYIKPNVIIRCFKKTATSEANIMKYLNVAEKNDASKSIAAFLSRGSSRRREGYSVYNKIYEFQANVEGRQTTMIMTSVSGHLLNYRFDQSYKNWLGCDPVELFEAPVSKFCPPNSEKIKRTLEREIRQCQGLIIWTDCDREGENIGQEIVQVCQAVKQNIKIFRAKFSEITATSISRALNNLQVLDVNVSNAVDIRQQLDLRIGAAFTRFQTLRLQRNFPTVIANQLVSYGSCQFPTLGFVVERYKEADSFIPQDFWKIKIVHIIDDLKVEFSWKRGRLFDPLVCQDIHTQCVDNPEATVLKSDSKRKTKWRPLPLDTVELEKLASRKLKINAKDTMKIAEKLYTQGYISYPRTETNIFPKDFNLSSLVEQQTVDNKWGNFAQRVLEQGPDPRAGKKSDQAHPPIHPTKHTTALSGNEGRIYEFIVRHFLACLSKDAVGNETTVEIEVAGEEFKATGLCILERNYLEVYPYDKWNAKEIHNYEVEQKFMPTNIDLSPGSTTAPSLLTEADLIALMDKHGIGTDATHAEHINTVKERGYIGEIEGGYLAPGTLGMGLVEGYDKIGLDMSKPHLRAGLEADLKLICEGRKNPREVLANQIAIYKKAYLEITTKATKLDDAVGERLHGGGDNNNMPRPPPRPPQPQLGEISTKISDPVRTNSTNSRHGNEDNSRNYNQNNRPQVPNRAPVPQTDNVRVNIPNQDWPSENNVRRNTSNHDWPGNNDWDRGTRDHQPTNVRANIPNQDWPSENSFPANDWDRGSRNTNASNAEAEPPMCNCKLPATKLTVRKDGPNKGRQFYKCFNGVDRGGCNYFLWASEGGEPPGLGNQNNWNNSAGVNSTSSTGSNWNASTGQSSGNTWNTNPTGRWNGRVEELNSGWGRTNPAPLQHFENNSSGGGGNSNTEVIRCDKCNAPAKLLTVLKDGPNKGRMFYTCPKPRGEQCTFFKWSDETDTGFDGGNSFPNNDRGSGRGRGRGRGGRGGGAKKRGSNSDATTGKRKCGNCRQEGHRSNKCPMLHD